MQHFSCHWSKFLTVATRRWVSASGRLWRISSWLCAVTTAQMPSLFHIFLELLQEITNPHVRTSPSNLSSRIGRASLPLPWTVQATFVLVHPPHCLAVATVMLSTK